MPKQKTVIIIAGPTASGKTDLSLQLAAHYNTSIISADSRQCYRELNIGVAKPCVEALNSVKHYFINSHSIHDTVNAQVFEKYALQSVEEIFKKSDVAIMVGGTGLYIKAFCEGLDEIPEVDISIRNEIVKNYKAKGLLWLQNEVKKIDPQYWMHAEQKNPQRLIRALEVITATGKSITAFRKNQVLQRPFNIIKTGINLPKQQLHANIDKRVDQMIEMGLINEVRTLLPFKKLNALQTVGYKELLDYISGNYSFGIAVKMIKTHTKQYAKRQFTWFEKDKEYTWIKNLQAMNMHEFGALFIN